MIEKFERYKFLEFFDYERIIEEDALDLEYVINLEEGFIFKLHVQIFDGYASITLNHNKLDVFIFNIAVNCVRTISCDESFLYFYKEDKEGFLYKEQKLIEPFLIVRIKPSVSFVSDVGF